MEPAGLAVGLLGLAGLFNTCLDLLDKFDSWRDFGSESRSLTARFRAHKLQLEKWGRAVGLEEGGLLDKHDKLLDDPRTLWIVEELLSAIKDICSYNDDTFPTSTPTIRKRRAHPHATLESKRQKLSWALRDKAKWITQVERFSSIVEILHSLIPIHEETGGVSKYGEPSGGDDSSGHLNDASVGREGWVTEFGRILSRIEGEIEAETRRDLQTWLLGNHLPNELYEIYMERRVQSTCEWILNRPWFLEWSSPDFPKGHAKVLWINGPAGFGKSILCARAIDHLSSMLEAPVAHFFFSSDLEREDPFVVVRSWVAQVISHPIAFALVREKWAAQQEQKATRGHVMNLLREIVTAIPGCTFIMDGLDECSWLKENQRAGDGDSIPGFIETLRRATADIATRLMIVSRDEPEIRACLRNDVYDASVFEHKITPEDTDTVKEKLSQKLADRCNGQFLWIKMQGDSLPRHSWKGQTELERVINSTPTGLEHVYERNWMKIQELPEEDRYRALSLLCWTAFSLRALTVNEMTEALLISEHCDEVRVDELPENIDMDYIDNGISQYCGSLLEVRSPQAECDAGLKTVHLAHFSVKQFLLYNIPTDGGLLQFNKALGSFTEPVENMLLAKMCLRYVNCLAVWRRNSHVEDDQVLGSFLNYAAGSWQQHASVGDPRDPGVVELVNRLFDIRTPTWTLWREWFELNDRKAGKNSP
ncbi:prion-inhibition and propagation-domain-containing protein [Aspergillus cavernicola]|uniref:Prion-inhibition and propagation-domain-containing protein n=1 Tax=Aspergillus cavernicola TaxID=176166 RepID=A0ABR4J0Z9_9EURO